jgi:hypothetical protein
MLGEADVNAAELGAATPRQSLLGNEGRFSVILLSARVHIDLRRPRHSQPFIDGRT